MKEWGARLLLLALGAAVALVAAEAYLRAYAPQPLNLLRMRPDGILLHAPNLDVELITEETRARVRTNAAGLRDVERPIKKPAGVTRILVLGDSMIEGLQVELEETMPKQIEARLSKALPGRKFDVINAGVSGSSAPLALRYLEREGLAYEPDLLVVTVTTRNDVHEAADTREFPLPPGYELRVYLRSRLHLYGMLEKAINNAPRVRNALAAVGILTPTTARPARKGVSTEVFLYDGNLEPFEEVGYGRLFEAYDQMMNLCRAGNIPVLFVIVPSYFQATGYAVALGPPARVGAIIRNAREIQDRILAFLEERGVPAVDLLPGARQNPEAYYLQQDQHFSVAGNAFAAGETVQAILDLNLLARADEAP